MGLLLLRMFALCCLAVYACAQQFGEAFPDDALDFEAPQIFRAQPRASGRVQQFDQFEAAPQPHQQPRFQPQPRRQVSASREFLDQGLIRSLSAATTTTPRTPSSMILKQLNQQNQDGSYTFGYESEDGSYRVETRGLDGLIKGKYGYLDQFGNLKEIEYTAGGKFGYEPSGEGIMVPPRAPPRKDKAPFQVDDYEDVDYDDDGNPIKVGGGAIAKQQLPQFQRPQRTQFQPEAAPQPVAQQPTVPRQRFQPSRPVARQQPLPQQAPVHQQQQFLPPPQQRQQPQPQQQPQIHLQQQFDLSNFQVPPQAPHVQQRQAQRVQQPAPQQIEPQRSFPRQQQQQQQQQQQRQRSSSPLSAFLAQQSQAQFK